MEETKPQLIIVGGPNGAGKTTFINTYLPEYTSVREFVNADLIAKGISPFNPEAALLLAGRILLRRVHSLLQAGTSFALESTLSGKSYAGLVMEAKSLGYGITIYYISLDSVELPLARIADRVRMGGHNVPRDDVLRRFNRSLQKFERLYLPLADNCLIFDNSGFRYIPKRQPVIALERAAFAASQSASTKVRDEHRRSGERMVISDGPGRLQRGMPLSASTMEVAGQRYIGDAVSSVGAACL